MIRNRMKRIAVAALAFALLLGGGVITSPHGARAEGIPVPDERAAFSVFDPSHLYLSNGSNSISVSTGNIVVGVSTTATMIVDSIGYTVYIQKWNGSSWETYGSGNTVGGSNAINFSGNVPKSVASGYYYRARTIHWVIENGVYEEGEKFTSSVLVP
ncbi:hypothetical protein [Cohnella sp. GCM10027633]|uniref:hypothetical protein n=1 Tax=unclassified Cohnella TaxID=2636738 RepID=UPI003637EECE